MNPYEANGRNLLVRVNAWVRGMVRLYRRPLLVLLLAGATTAMGVRASEPGPVPEPQAAPGLLTHAQG